MEDRPRVPWLNIALFLVTCLTTLLAGAFLTAGFNHTVYGAALDEGFWWNPSNLLDGLPFCLAIMTILVSHEMGHYLTCRYYGIDASLPYFIPFPNAVGTMGAFIRIRAPFQDRGSLLEVGVAGPIAGFIVTLIVLIFSVRAGQFVPLESLEGGSYVLGEPLIYKVAAYLTGMTPPPGMEVYMHPVCFAAWFGLLATALNLLPAAQLDGGHVIYALFRGHHRWISAAVVGVLVPLAIFYWVFWVVWIVLLLVLRLYHPPTLNDSAPLERRHVILGWIGLVILILCFTPAPVVLNLE